LIPLEGSSSGRAVLQLKNKIPLVDLKRQYVSIKQELDEAISRVLTSGQYVSGENVEGFERELGAYLGVKYVIGVGSGTDALELSMRAIDLRGRKNCVAPANTFFSIVSAVENSGGSLKFADIEKTTFNIDSEFLETRVDGEALAVVPAHAYGQPGDMDRLVEFGEQNSCRVVEDVAQALGATWKGKKAGAVGDISCLSFYPTKNLGAYGDAGAVATNDAQLAGRIRALRNYGEEKRYYHTSVGRNSRLDEIQAAVLRVKLRHLDSWNQRRRDHARLYSEYLEPMEEIDVPIVGENREHVFSSYVISCEHRDKLQAFLNKSGISTEIQYPRALHQQPACLHLGYKGGDFPTAEKAATRILSLPMYPELATDEIAIVCERIRDFYATST